MGSALMLNVYHRAELARNSLRAPTLKKFKPDKDKAVRKPSESTSNNESEN